MLKKRELMTESVPFYFNGKGEVVKKAEWAKWLWVFCGDFLFWEFIRSISHYIGLSKYYFSKINIRLVGIRGLCVDGISVWNDGFEKEGL